MTLVGLDFGTSGSAYPMQRPEPGTVLQIRRTASAGTPPALASPAQGQRALASRVPFLWTAGGTVEFELALDPAFAEIVRRETVSADPFAEPFVVTGLHPTARYYWRVRHVPSTVASLPVPPWSETWSFTAATSVAAGATSAPVALALDAPRPNPTRAGARLRVGMPTDGDAAVEVFDVLGRRVAVAHEGPLSAGWTDVSLRTESLPSGVYVVRLTSGRTMRTQTLVVTR